MERWGVFSVVDHKNPIRLATELLLYDKIVVPTPMDGPGGTDWKRWAQAGWAPDKLMEVVNRLKVPNLVYEAKWDLERQTNWRKQLNEIKQSVKSVNRDTRSQEKELGFSVTRCELIRHLRGNIPIHYGIVDFFAAYQTKTDFDDMHPTEKTVERVNMLITYQLLIPEAGPEDLLDQAIKLVTDDTYRARREEFYKLQDKYVQRKDEPERIFREINKCVEDFNQQHQKHFQKVRWETVVAILGVVGAGLTAAGGFTPDLGHYLGADPDLFRKGIALVVGVNAVGPVVIRKTKLGRSAPDASNHVAAAGAMFHQIASQTGIEFKTKPRLL